MSDLARSAQQATIAASKKMNFEAALDSNSQIIAEQMANMIKSDNGKRRAAMR